MMLRSLARRWLLAEEAARILGVTPRHVRRLASTGVLLARRLGGLWWVDADSVEHYLSTRGWCNRYGTRGGRLQAEREETRR